MLRFRCLFLFQGLWLFRLPLYGLFCRRIFHGLLFGFRLYFLFIFRGFRHRLCRFRLDLHFRLLFRCFGFSHGLFFRFRFFFLFRDWRCRALAHTVKVNFSQRLERLALFEQLFSFRGFAFGFLGFLVLGFLGEYLFGFALDILVAFKRTHKRVVLLYRYLGVDIGILFDLAEIFFVFQEIDSRLKSYVQFF